MTAFIGRREMLKEIAPAVTRAAIVSNPKTVPYDYFLHGAESAAPSLGLQIVPGRVENTADIERTIESLAQVPDGGMILPPVTTTVVNRNLIIALAAKHGYPRFTPSVFSSQAGVSCPMARIS
jgi:putative tryptophan/tyrosine transport system substrate-binding protein